MPKLVAMVRVKDGILFVQDWLDVMEKLVDEIVVVDNGSTDGTLEILQAHSKVVDIAKTHGFDEGRDKILVYEMARKRKPDWCVWLDIDEIFEKRVTRAIVEKMMSNSKYNKFAFRLYHFTKDRKHLFFYYKPIGYNFGYPRVLWKEQTSGFFKDIKIHNGGIQGIVGKTKRTNFRLKHFGYVDKQYIEKKTYMYMDVDPERKEMYLKHFEKTPGKIIRWYEYDENPFKVKMQLVIYNTIHLILRNLGKLKRIFVKKVSKID